MYVVSNLPACRRHSVTPLCQYHATDNKRGVEMLDVTVTDRTMTVVAEGDITSSEWLQLLQDNDLLGGTVELTAYWIEPDGAEVMHYSIVRVDSTTPVPA